MKERYITGVIKRPGEKAFVYPKIDNSLEGLQKLVGGYIETVTVEDCVVICNEEGRLLGMKPNCRFRNVDFVGPVIAVGIAGENFASLGEGTAGVIASEMSRGAFSVRTERELW